MGFISERERHDLRDWANEAMGEPRADIFMRSLPPNGWEDLATKTQVQAVQDAVEQAVEAAGQDAKRDSELLRHQLTGEFHATVTHQTVRLTIAFAAMTVAAILSESVMPHWFPPPVPEIVVQVPSAS